MRWRRISDGTRLFGESLANDIETVEAVNKQLNQMNDRVLPVLKTLTGQELGPDPEPWRKWWTDQLGYVYQSSQQENKPTFSDTVSMPNTVVNLPVLQLVPPRHASQPEPWSTRSMDREKSSRSRLATASCPRTHRPAFWDFSL